MIEDFSNPEYKPKIQILKDYEKKEFSNPYFEHKRPVKIGFNTKFYLKILAVLFLIYLAVYSDLFKIEKIEIVGNDLISTAELTQAVQQELGSWHWFLIPQKNFIFMSKNKLKEGIAKNFDFNRFEISRGWKSIKITVEEKISHLILYNQDKFYFTDSDGKVVREVPKEEAEARWDKFPVLNVGRIQINSGDQIVSAKMVDFILKLDAEIKKSQLVIFGYEARGEDEAALVAKEGWRAYFDINADLKNALDNMFLVLKEKVPDKNKLQYIDLKFGNKVYLK